jgi:hypothetical protein
LRRLRYATSIGCHSADGTFLAFGPDRNLPRLLGWLTEIDGTIRDCGRRDPNPVA